MRDFDSERYVHTYQGKEKRWRLWRKVEGSTERNDLQSELEDWNRIVSKRRHVRKLARFCSTYNCKIPTSYAIRVFHFSNFSIFPRFRRWFPCVFPCWMAWNNSFCRKRLFYLAQKSFLKWNAMGGRKIEMCKSLQMGARKMRNAEWWEDSKSDVRI